MARYWINRVFADGSETSYEDSAQFPTERAAMAYASRTDGRCYVVDEGTVIALYVNGVETPLCGTEKGAL
jgi:hypothetical protein